jgi:glutamate/aspartate transport system substrate-binding protein
MALVCNGGAAQAAEVTGTLKKIRDSGVITIGHREASSPFSFLDSNKQPVGYAIDLCLRIVDEVKAVLEKPDLATKYVMVNPQTRIPLVVDGSVDLECVPRPIRSHDSNRSTSRPSTSRPGRVC